jgi:hypothetical protein
LVNILSPLRTDAAQVRIPRTRHIMRHQEVAVNADNDARLRDDRYRIT